MTHAKINRTIDTLRPLLLAIGTVYGWFELRRTELQAIHSTIIHDNDLEYTLANDYMH